MIWRQFYRCRRAYCSSALSKALRVAKDVSSADRPVVALESTVITHGLPYPRNVETALQIEAAVKANGAQPATIGIIDGVPHVGLSTNQLERLGQAGPTATKVSRRDIAVCMARRALGGTTVSATMILAHMAGIDMFSTGRKDLCHS